MPHRIEEYDAEASVQAIRKLLADHNIEMARALQFDLYEESVAASADQGDKIAIKAIESSTAFYEYERSKRLRRPR